MTCAMTFQLIYWGTYPHIHPKIHLPIYFHASLSSNHKDLPVTTTTCVHACRCTRSWSYLFILYLHSDLTVKIYPSTVLLFYMSIDVPLHHYICSVYFVYFSLQDACRTFQCLPWQQSTNIEKNVSNFKKRLFQGTELLSSYYPFDYKIQSLLYVRFITCLYLVTNNGFWFSPVISMLCWQFS